eukprot:4190227-Amphidinium_carterae.1
MSAAKLLAHTHRTSRMRSMSARKRTSDQRHPEVYYLGTTRPYTGAFGCLAELNALFVLRMLTDDAFNTEMQSQFPGLKPRSGSDKLAKFREQLHTATHTR